MVCTVGRSVGWSVGRSVGQSVGRGVFQEGSSGWLFGPRGRGGCWCDQAKMTNLLFNDCLVQISNNYRDERYKEVLVH